MHHTETTWPSSNIHRHMSLPFPSGEGALLCMAIRCARPTKPKPLGTRVWAEWLCLLNDCTSCSQPLPPTRAVRQWIRQEPAQRWSGRGTPFLPILRSMENEKVGLRGRGGQYDVLQQALRKCIPMFQTTASTEEPLQYREEQVQDSLRFAKGAHSAREV
eukprot:CAMPEP_0174311084 /NCGR_PEP_ID=MMETSP0810-20121108/3490_1 /TAXON_ID=73025 ORGANISM="Eutreptiella gymnastica-like, Strain CCMP1594" /NCGR_SAMPLE_ID=MMETSP0810 /ASSEMBLY_ACC=CAM_ASM_000659 /LENGTH=159 /DNA_ID=CAMNT_0015419231 /DNA_START=326 /DNA_END=801 /DNA_ORIENTATION=-